MGQSRKMKDILALSKSIASFSDGQASVNMPEDCLNSLVVRIKPNGGLYMGGIFDFEMNLENYPENKPAVRCLTKIYHPNIDCMEEEDNVCLNILDSDWTDSTTLEDAVHGLLFLLYNPNLEDPLSPLFDSETTYEEFAENVTKSLKGEEIDDFQFDFNFSAESEDAITNKTDNCEAENIHKEIKVDDDNPELIVDCEAKLTNIGKDADIHDDTKDTDSTKEDIPKNIPATFERQTSKVDIKAQIDEKIDNYRMYDSSADIDKKVPQSMIITPVFNDNLMPEINMVTKMLPKFLDHFLCCIRTMKAKDDV